MNRSLLVVELRSEEDVVVARQRARQIAELLGFERQDQVRLATATSEIARNAVIYGGGGHLEFALEGRSAPQVLALRIVDQGRGIAELPAVLAGRYQSTTGMGIGIRGARRLVDQFQIDSTPDEGTTVVLRKLLAPGGELVDGARLAAVSDALRRQPASSPAAELQRQNQELVSVLDELRRRQEELLRLNRELDDTNRGVLALYAELDEKADHLRRADETKSRFLSNMSHEFRTPLNSILALSRLLLERTDGELTTEQDRQVGFIRKAAEDLQELVNDLLDLAKVEAGKIVVRPGDLDPRSLFGALRGMLRPLAVDGQVQMVFEEPPPEVPILWTDEGKVAQILRNFLSNALKFTERGEIRTTVRLEGENVIFAVADTGIGIAPEDQEGIFGEFSQVDHRLQRRVKGTGLGLALSRRLAELLGGRITLDSTPGLGSTFRLHLPRDYSASTAEPPAETAAPAMAQPRRPRLLVVADSEAKLRRYADLLEASAFEPLGARSADEARVQLRGARPLAVLLDAGPGDDAWGLIGELKQPAEGASLPVLVVSDDVAKAQALGADGAATPPAARDWLLGELERLTGVHLRRALIVDDDPGARYVLCQMATLSGLAPIESSSVAEGVRLALDQLPDVVLLDYNLPDHSGAVALAELRANPVTAHLPVLVITSLDLDPAERDEIEHHGAQLLSKRTWGEDTALDQFHRALAASGLAFDEAESK